MPAYNEAGVRVALENTLKGMLDVGEGLEWTLFVVDDGSTDDTYQKIKEAADQLNLRQFAELIIIKNPKNLGLDGTLLNTYRLIEGRQDIQWILKTDLDADFDQSAVLRELIPRRNLKEIVIGQRVYPLDVNLQEVNYYEYTRLKDCMALIETEFGIRNFDPSSVGSQIYSIQVLRQLLSLPPIMNHTKRWGLDILIPLVYGGAFQILPLEGKYFLERRGKQKVQQSYDNFVELIAHIKNKIPHQISPLYHN
uniref:Glycosyltransferase 2-like domain-containing protein n=1 Tax=Arcella intermedia TaxID=1963864 RepID=A0A6B2LEP2_9EUKA